MTRTAGEGILEFSRVAGRTALTRARADSPLTLLSPRRRASDFSWAVCGTLGGGLVAGDEIHLDVHVQRGCSAVLGTQASTKIYRSPDGQTCRQIMHTRVDADGILLVLPDTVACFAGAIYDQRQRFDLAESASLVVVDWITSGRRARGERWEMTSCRLRTDVFVENRQILRDALRLDSDDLPNRMSACDCLATVIIVGHRLVAAVEQTLAWIASQRVTATQDLIFSAGPIPGGMLLRVAGVSTEQVLQFFRTRLPMLPELTGHDPWSGK